MENTSHCIFFKVQWIWYKPIIVLQVLSLWASLLISNPSSSPVDFTTKKEQQKNHSGHLFNGDIEFYSLSICKSYVPEAEAGLSGEAGTSSAPSKPRTLKGGHRPRWRRQPESPAPGHWPVWPFNRHSEISSVIVIKRGAISLSTYCVLGGTFAVSCELSLWQMMKI